MALSMWRPTGAPTTTVIGSELAAADCRSVCMLNRRMQKQNGSAWSVLMWHRCLPLLFSLGNVFVVFVCVQVDCLQLQCVCTGSSAVLLLKTERVDTSTCAYITQVSTQVNMCIYKSSHRDKQAV